MKKYSQLVSLIFLLSFFASTQVALAQKRPIPKGKPHLKINILCEWEKIIAETSIKNEIIDHNTKEYYVYEDFIQKQNSFILHYKIASVEKITKRFNDSIKTKELKEYTLSYDKKGLLITLDDGVSSTAYFYDEKGRLDSAFTSSVVIADPHGKSGWTIAKENNTWDIVKGKTEWIRLVEKEVFMSTYNLKEKKAEYFLEATIKYLYINDGLLSEMHTYDATGNLKHLTKFVYTFYD